MFRSFVQRYNGLKLQSKFTLALVLMVFIPGIFIAVFFYSQLYDMVISNTIRKEQDAAAKTVPSINTFMEGITETASDLTKSTFYQSLFFQPIKAPISELLTSNEESVFEDHVQDLIQKSRLTSIHFYIDLPENTLTVSADTPENELFSSLNSARTYWRGIFHSNNTLKELYCPSNYLGPKERELYGDQAYIRKTTLYYNENPVDVFIVFYYSGESLVSLLQENLLLEQSVSYIVNDRNDIVVSSNNSLTGTYLLDYSTIENSFMSSNNFVIRTILRDEVYAGFYRINAPSWFMVTVLPSTPMIHQGNVFILQIVLIYIAFLVLALLMATLLSRSITKRISSVIRQMRKVREGPPIPMKSSNIHDEVGDLIDTYNYMTGKMSLLMTKQAQAAEDLRIAEFNSLQAQINPHFLYNTMDMINWMAQQGQTDEISEAVQSLSRFYKLTLSKKHGISTIANEVEHVSIYLRLQNMRYKDRINFISDIPDELNEYCLPKLTLQPIIENSVIHGILETESKSGTIVLTGWLEDHDIILMISDDGVGIPAEKLSTILSGNGSSSSGGSNIAVYNTHRRLQILYGDGYGLSYSSTPGTGTEVEIRLPAYRSE